MPNAYVCLHYNKFNCLFMFQLKRDLDNFINNENLNSKEDMITEVSVYVLSAYEMRKIAHTISENRS